jgi:hypothetical protein
MTVKTGRVLLGWLAVAVLLSGAAAGSGDTENLLQLNEEVLYAYVVESDTGPLEAIALPEMQVMTPGGLEDLERVIATVSNLDIDEMTIENHAANVSGDTAIVSGVLILKGSIGPRPAPPRMGFMTTFVKRDGRWRQLARTLMPLGPPPMKRP